jgi:hypothetical protein
LQAKPVSRKSSTRTALDAIAVTAAVWISLMLVCWMLGAFNG